jgi:AcrR family transcriptional regulator
MARPKRPKKQAAKQPRAERQEETRLRILEAARKLFAAKGVAGLSIRAIAARAGMPAMTLYSYFPGKMGIVRALWSEAFGPLFVEMETAEKSEPDPKERLRKVAQTMVDYWMQHPDRYKIVFLIEDRREKEDDKWFIEETDVVPALFRFKHLIAEARNDPGGDYQREAETLICCLIGITHMLVGVSEYPWARSNTYVDMVVRGLC